MHRAIFLDRDGVLIENRSEYVREWSQVTFLPQAIEALALLHEYKVVIVTNQSAVGRGLISLETAFEINQRLVEKIKEGNGQIDGVYMCPHTPEDECNCRKPNPGLILQAAEELSLDLHQSWMIGDAWSDLMAGKAAGVHGVALLKTGRGIEQLAQSHNEDLVDYFVFNDLSSAIAAIRKMDNIVAKTE